MIDAVLIAAAAQRLADAALGARSSSSARMLAAEPVRLRRELRDLRIPIDIVVVSERYVEEWRDVPGGIVHAALADGRQLAG